MRSSEAELAGAESFCLSLTAFSENSTENLNEIQIYNDLFKQTLWHPANLQ